ncbi:MAG: branched-chain amino acid aminotransferase [Myxococcota bacterium]
MLDGLEVRRTSKPKPVPSPAPRFGSIFSDHIFSMHYQDGTWQRPVIEPYEDIQLGLGASVLHYAQTVFEGMKAFAGPDGRVQVFRPEAHAARFARSARRICMPELPPEIFVESVMRLVAEDARWVRGNPEGALYIRPLMFATEPFLGVRPSNDYRFVVMSCPVGTYSGDSFSPTRIWVERQAVRAAPGGVGEAKTGGNYAASLAGQMAAKSRGYDQVLWTDALRHENVEEVGTMNVFFRFEDEVATPALSGTILPGITRASVIELLADKGVNVKERQISVREVIEGARTGRLLEVFGTGTAAVVTPVGVLGHEEGETVIGSGEPGSLTKELFDRLSAMQRGLEPDPKGWLKLVTA